MPTTLSHTLRTALSDHPGFSFTCAGPHYRLHHHGEYVGTFAHLGAMLAEVAEREAGLCAHNNCGHVDTEAPTPDDHGHVTPHDWAALTDSLQHALGLLTGPSDCSVCHYATEAGA